MKENIRVCKHFTISPSGLTLLTRLAPIFIYVYYLYYLYLLWKLHCGFLGIVKRQFFKPNAIQKFWDMFRKFTICFDLISKMNVLYPSAIANPFSAFYFLDIFHKIARIEALRPKTTLHRTRALICSKHCVCTFEFEIYPLHCDFMKVPLNATLIVFRFWCQLRSVERALEKINIATWH